MTDVAKRSLDSLYAELQPQLRRILACNLDMAEWVIDDACQTAWGLLLTHRDAVSAGGELGWLSTTATRAALRLLRRERCVEMPVESPEEVRAQEHRGGGGGGGGGPDPEQALEVHERLAEIRRLPVRQQRLVLLHGFGYEYEEIAAVTGDTRRTVARQLLSAYRRLDRLAADG